MSRSSFAGAVVLTAWFAVGCQSAPDAEPVPPTDAAAPLPGGPSVTLPSADALWDVTVVQRRRAFVPGSDRQLRVQIGDITAGQVLTKLTSADGDELVAQRSMRTGDAVAFTYGGQQLVLGVLRLQNFLIGDDFAEFQIGPRAAVAATQIGGLLEKIETSGLTFVRNGDDHDAAATVAHLRRKLTAAADAVDSGDAFIESIATRSSTTGEEYRVRLDAERTVPLADWLRGKGQFASRR